MGEKERPRALLHILPTLLWWAIFLFTLGRHIQNPIIPRIYGFTCLLSLLSYGILIQLILARYAKKLKNQISYTDMFLEVKWLSYMAGALVIITLFVSVGITLYLRQNAPSAPPIHKLLGDPDSIDIMHSLAVLTFLFVFTLLAQKQERLGFKSLPTKSPCSPKDEPERPETASHAFTELTSFMDKSKIYLENTLSLQVLSDKTGINRNELSRLINKETGENFFHFINGYRAREFKEALKEDRFPCYNLLAIAHECGFNSKATFNSAIKREFDVTPSQIYREIGSTL
jgi:AraC-like DNA-binding protein